MLKSFSPILMRQKLSIFKMYVVSVKSSLLFILFPLEHDVSPLFSKKEHIIKRFRVIHIPIVRLTHIGFNNTVIYTITHFISFSRKTKAAAATQRFLPTGEWKNSTIIFFRLIRKLITIFNTNQRYLSNNNFFFFLSVFYNCVVSLCFLEKITRYTSCNFSVSKILTLSNHIVKCMFKNGITEML